MHLGSLGDLRLRLVFAEHTEEGGNDRLVATPHQPREVGPERDRRLLQVVVRNLKYSGALEEQRPEATSKILQKKFWSNRS